MFSKFIINILSTVLITHLEIYYLYIYFRFTHPTPVLLPGKSYGRRSLVGCSPWGRWGSDTTEWHHFRFSISLKKLEKEMATHCSVLAWRTPGMVEPGGLPSMGSHRVGHDWSDLAAAAAAAAFEIFDISIKTNVCTDDSNLLLKQHIMNIQQIPSIMLVTFQGIKYWALWHYVSSWKEHAIAERDEASERDRSGSFMVP